MYVYTNVFLSLTLYISSLFSLSLSHIHKTVLFLSENDRKPVTIDAYLLVYNFLNHFSSYPYVLLTKL